MTKRGKSNNTMQRKRKRNVNSSGSASQSLDAIARLTAPISGTSLPSAPDVREMHLRRQKIHTIYMTQTSPVAGSTAGVDYSNAYQFALSSFPNSTEYTALYEEYRIVQIKVQFTATSPTNAGSPLLTAIDYDDANAPILGTLLQYQTLQTTPAGLSCTRIFTPKVALAAFASGVFASSALRSMQWIDNNSPGVAHYGLKAYIQALAGNTAVWSVTFSAVVQFRNVS